MILSIYHCRKRYKLLIRVAEKSSYQMADDTKNRMLLELVRFKDFLVKNTADLTSETSGVILQDGGELRNHTLSELPKEIWSRFQDDFLNRTDGI